MASRYCSVLALTVLAWSSLTAAPGRQNRVFRASVQEVVLDVAVSRAGVPVRDLQARHFTIVDNGVPRPAVRVLHESVPLNLVLCLDTSSSLGAGGLQRLQEAADALLQSLRPDDRVGLVTFSESVDVRVLPTTRHALVGTALRLLQPQGPTAWRDALFVATQIAQPVPGARSVVLLLTDGSDTSSWMRGFELEAATERAGVVVHGIALEQPPAEPRNGRGTAAPEVGDSPALRRAIEGSGGRLWSAGSERDLRRLFLEALQELRDRYLIAFAPAEPIAPGWHKVAVRLDDVKGDVLARPGYWVPSGQ